MPNRRARLSPQSAHGQLAAALAALREGDDVPVDFSPEALAEAASAAPADTELDLRRIPFVTLDPPGARDLDQAFHLERSGDGFRVRYAIADLPGFVPAGGALDREARQRGQTLYLPDGRIPLHPAALSEDRASLLPGSDRTAYVWTLDLDAAGALASARVERAHVRSRAQLDYPSAQAAIDGGGADELLELLRTVGVLRIEQERLRGGASLNMPDEEIVRDPGGYRIVRSFALPVEEWNAQLSLLTGMAAGRMMLDAGVGILRTMPGPDEEALAAFRARVASLGHPWPAELGYGAYLERLDPASPTTPAVLQAAASLFRGADYTPFDGEPPQQTVQAAIAAPYAHVTAPLRRLVDRWGLVICAAICADRPVPEWVRASLGELPALMRASNQRAGRLGSQALDRVEAALLRDRVGDILPAVVVEVRGDRARVQLDDPAVTTQISAAGCSAGTHVDVRVVAADVATGAIELTLVARDADPDAGGDSNSESAAPNRSSGAADAA
ncbi:RNB domain-containing ribonuclease [Leucobacter chromiiresistens]|uniref:Exoribonuclease R n=1 Tax=Leucobacter chromiiresistens TaxID=1079994 RepID=A0A1H0ZDS7_9MICO|nr:RNB domain-containing ribonuclease [Leucobacter chromiiresistens]SDQ25311.1 Exoribonuclease R [Leucobacter chromiiresistens]